VEIELPIVNLSGAASYKFTDLTFRGTVEHSSVCSQSLAESPCALALLAIITLAECGSKARGRNEDASLQPLFERAERLANPALEQLRRQTADLSPEQTILNFATF
jgi:hypothetical protein